MKHFLLSGVRFYKKWLSPVLPGACRFAPSCSAYTIEAIERYGAVKGSVLSVGRLARCHPFNPGGWDPVPPIARPVSECGSNGVTGSSLCECADKQLADSTQYKYVRGSKVSGSVLHPDTPTPRYPGTLRG